MKEKVKILGDRAEQVIQHFKDDPFERFRLLYKVDLRPFQWEWFLLMDEYPDTLAIACPRVGKTFEIEAKCLDEQVQFPYEDELIFAPKAEQAEKTFEVQRNIIERSEPLKAYIKRGPGGKPRFGEGYVRFQNESGVKCFGANSNFEGENATILRIEEFDDIPADTVKRMLGRAIGKNRNGRPTRHRYSGVIWGRLNIYKYETEKLAFVLPKVDIYTAIQAGYIDEEAAMQARAEMTDDEWLRTMCLIYVETRNFIWESWLHRSQMIGLKWGLFPIPPHPDGIYKKRGIVSFGLDMGRQGGSDESSDYALEVTESVGLYRRWLWGRTWPPDTDPAVIISDVCDYWEFYNPDIGYGDAVDANLIAQINEELWRRGAVDYNWKRAGKNVQDGWGKWAEKGLLTPIHNNGPTKHAMFMSLKHAINSCMNISDDTPAASIFIFPLADREKAKTTKSWRHLQMLIRELSNLIGVELPSGIYRIERNKKKIEDEKLGFSGRVKLGDDRPDALAMSNFGLDLRQKRDRGGTKVKLEYVRGF